MDHINVKQNIAKNSVMICSGKGGVGKSTMAAVIALSLAKKGLKVALLDSDIYGPSIPHLFKIKNDGHEMVNDKLTPSNICGIEIMSMGMLMPEKNGIVWRGPMLSKMIKHMLQNTAWSQDLDYMIIDTPPGTGDIHITLTKDYGINECILVSTPSHIAISDVIRAKDAMKNLGICKTSLIINMSYIEYNGINKNIFGNTTPEQCAELIEIEKFIQIPLLEKIANFDIDWVLRNDFILNCVGSLL
ncbi:putative ABC transporter ATP-binding protein [Candidatus Cyrtobacter comes]|uniref:Iron-sulfur cluster carrier protein n=1 Tax=Candidatus Cyrtobacter comes TaxID=675776 RepID=A0ABU5L6B3_9RICK|nr:P-loop NTPase [Candidatus Cyrtobacter comes]MDZ5761661.1 putative ABC transporter ATP-binding protein [Candidatus Cyrtobacter comes]